VKHGQEGSFYEANHLEGDTNLVAIMRAIIDNDGYAPDADIPMRPDHGHQMLDDLNKDQNPGYSAIGRLKGLAELRGLEIGLRYR
jgi:mannonate dehydratase